MVQQTVVCFEFVYSSLNRGAGLVAYADSPVDSRSNHSKSTNVQPKKKKIVVLGTGWAGTSFLKDLDISSYEHRRAGQEHNKKRVGEIKYWEAKCLQIDPESKKVFCKANLNEALAGSNDFSLNYDYLVIALGARVNTFNTPGVLEYCHFIKVDDELLSGEAEQSVPSPAKIKTRRLPSLVNKGNISTPYSFRRNRKANARKAIPSQGSDSPTDNPEKSVDGRSEGSRLSIDLNKSAQYKQETNPKNPLTEAGNIRNYDETVTEGASSSKSIGKSKAKISGKNLRNCDVATRPTKKNRGQTKPVNVPQGLNFHAQTVADTSSNQHAKRVAQVWLSLDSSGNQ
ncbi:hypothetical protein POM88_043543 [Heracleum sosnowskyi]|uniref:FAD/NAD(P)-binding domain-containing protein n=1 Tax=Heracleum sosnowskyi TaxID=360622 RepID=A0AAD8H3J9_9APIA|nr:hypothetical protein POM88_043543 [Heracleum sosnowskyi]